MTWLKSCREPYLLASRFLTIFSLRRGLLTHLLSSGLLLAAELELCGAEKGATEGKEKDDDALCCDENMLSRKSFFN